MKVLLISVVLLQAWCNALPQPRGVASYAFQDPSGKRYGGTYELGDNVLPFSEQIIPPISSLTPYRDDYVPPFFNHFGNILQHDNFVRAKRRLLFGRLKRLRERFPFGGFPFGGFGAFNMDRLAHNSAFSGAIAGPGYTHQSAIINPPNLDNPNVVVTNRFNEPTGPGNFYSVSSSSFASSNNDNGKLSGFRGSETVVNNNGKVTKYRVHS